MTSPFPGRHPISEQTGQAVGLYFLLGVVALLPGPEAVRADSKHLAEEKALKSPHADLGGTHITFVNQCPQAVRLYWLDYEGRRILYNSLNARDSYTQQTYQAHPWIVTDANDNALDLIFPESDARIVELDFRDGPRTVSALTRDGRMMAFASRTANVPLRLYETGTGLSRLAEPVKFPAVRSLTFLTSEILAAVGGDGTAKLFEVRTGRQLATLEGTLSDKSRLSGSIDGRRLEGRAEGKVTHSWDTSRWAGFRPEPKGSADDLSPLWDTLIGDDAAAAFAAMGEMAARPEPARKFLRDRLGNTLAADPGHVSLLIEQLDHDEFRVRERATRELKALGIAAVAAVRRARQVGSLEVRTRAEVLLRTLPDERKLLRVLELLEQLGAVDALALEKAAALVGETFQAEVRAAVERLDQARGKKPRD